ncbi:shikimate dehydrogenase [Alteraurantiacibacter buctensis]|uniref:Shikimate dehydrogenase (NADP(+)) n=1 Tax=Alteraurantiacibacter buctensis TaxID=1503981 RepID=A0A844Z2W1_9SPHN|nr:shikimate dehydrogenase [Alteraurantiacibacter buctensis]MXO73321.1 shikimate dehydrogenase [Alteraurantiacibacter buctensis]
MLRTGLIGRSILASRSPWLHEQEAAAQGIELAYELFDFTDREWDDSALGRLLDRLAAEGYAGVNITFPFKQAVIPLLDELADCARLVGAVNTVAMRDGRKIGYNTDKTGFETSLAEGLPGAALDRVLQLGAGGAGAAVANALLSAGTGTVMIADLDLARAENLAALLSGHFGPGRAVACRMDRLDTSVVDGIVNTTPMGMATNPAPAIAVDLIAPRHWVADIVYFPLETELLRAARLRGCRTLDGSGMVIGQAARAFEIFTERRADRHRMRASFSRHVGADTLPGA